eukprot:2397313-Rhodomonas_salina.5
MQYWLTKRGLARPAHLPTLLLSPKIKYRTTQISALHVRLGVCNVQSGSGLGSGTKLGSNMRSYILLRPALVCSDSTPRAGLWQSRSEGLCQCLGYAMSASDIAQCDTRSRSDIAHRDPMSESDIAHRDPMSESDIARGTPVPRGCDPHGLSCLHYGISTVTDSGLGPAPGTRADQSLAASVEMGVVGPVYMGSHVWAH